MTVTLRSMTQEDVEAVDAMADAAYTDLRRRLHDDEATGWLGGPEHAARRQRRLHHLLTHDPDGATVAIEGDRVVGVALALRRERFWGLSLITVVPGRQTAGLGRRLMDRALVYSQGCEAGLINSSPDSRAIRLYARAGFALRPTLSARGRVRREALVSTPRVREGSASDLDLAAAIDRGARGGPHGADLEVMLEAGARLLVVDGRGYAVLGAGQLLLLAATDAASARELLWASLAAAPPDEETRVGSLMGGQDWAFQIVLEAGLALKPAGPLCTRGALGDLTHYLPNGAYL